MRFSIIPRDEQFYALFGQLAQRLKSSTAYLQQLFEGPDRLAELVDAIKREEHAADDLTRAIVQRINTTFVTPLDREDIYLLATKLDTVIDLIDGTARRVQILRIGEPREPARRQAEILVRAAAALDRGVTHIKTHEVVDETSRVIKALEEEADTVYHEAVGALFDGRTEALDVIRWKELFDRLEDAVDECEDVANVLEAISLKHL